MNCKSYQIILDAYIDATVTPQQIQQLEAHIQSCESCRREYETHRKMKMVLSECLMMSEPSEQTIQSIMTNAAGREVASGSTIGFFWKIAAVILLIAAVGLGFTAGRFLPSTPSIKAVRTAYQIKSLEGTVLVRHPGSNLWQPITKDTAIYIGDEFLSTPKANVIFTVAKNSTITLNQNSMLVLKTTGDNTELYLANGALDADLESPHGPFFVTTPHGRAEALGTEFTINVE
jgi:hypothetical protein